MYFCVNSYTYCADVDSDIGSGKFKVRVSTNGNYAQKLIIVLSGITMYLIYFDGNCML
jgi:hypothetical protein